MNYIVTINGKTYEVSVERAAGGYKSVGQAPVKHTPAAAKSVTPAPAPTSVPVAPATPAASAPPAAQGSVVSPMPGVVLNIKANPGDVVRKGQPIVILEAMKMELEVPAPCDGIVGAIHVKKGDNVATGAVLADLK